MTDSKIVTAQIVASDLFPSKNKKDENIIIQLTLKTRVDSNLLVCGKGEQFLVDLFEILEKDSWKELENACLRVKIDNGKVIEIGHWIENNWIVEF